MIAEWETKLGRGQITTFSPLVTSKNLRLTVSWASARKLRNFQPVLLQFFWGTTSQDLRKESGNLQHQLNTGDGSKLLTKWFHILSQF